MRCRFVLPPYLTLKNFEGLDLGKMDQVRVSFRVVYTLQSSCLFLSSLLPRLRTELKAVVLCLGFAGQ